MDQHPPASRVTTHRLSHQEISALAWMLETAADCPDAECIDELTDGAAAFRMVATCSRHSSIDLHESSIDALTSIAWDVLDQAERQPELIVQIAGFEWDRIGEELAHRDDTGVAFAAFLMECPTPRDLPSYAAMVVARLRASAGTEILIEI